MTTALFLLVITIANAIQAITGFAGTVLAMPPTAYLLGLDSAKVVLNCMGWLSCLFIAWTGRSHIQWRVTIRIWLVMLPTMVFGAVLCQYVPSEALLLQVYGCVILAVGLKNLFRPSHNPLPPVGQYGVLVSAGLIHGMFVSGGALLVIYATDALPEKEEFRATVASVWVVMNAVLLLQQHYSGLVTPDALHLVLLAILPLIFATYVGTKLAHKINQKLFLNMVYVLLCISGLSLLI